MREHRPFLLVLILAACQSAAPRPGIRETAVKPVTLTDQQITVLTREYVRRFAGEVEMAADRIESGTDDPAVRRAALMWKLNAVPASIRASYDLDPSAAMIDAWTLAVQMRLFFTEGAGRDAFGPAQGIAVDTARGLEDEATRIASQATGGGGPPPVASDVQEWAASHPIRDLLFVRESTQTSTILLVPDRPRSALQTVVSLDERMDDLGNRLAVMVNYLPRLALWQAELILLNETGGRRLRPTLDDVAAMRDSMARMTTVVEGLEAAIGRVRKDTLVDVRALAGEQVQTVCGEIDRQRLATLEAIAEERATVVAEVDAQRVKAVSAVRTELAELRALLQGEVAATREELGRQRQAAMQEADAIAGRAGDRGEAAAFAAVDRMAWRLTQLAAALVVVAGLGGFLLVRFARRR